LGEELFEDLEKFNKELMGYLIWYNGERPHSGLQQVSPIKYLYYAIKKYYKVSKDMDLYIVLKILKISLSCI
jgi:hypothetical protein